MGSIEHEPSTPSVLPMPGLMGYNATPAMVELVLAAFKDGLRQQGFLKS